MIHFSEVSQRSGGLVRRTRTADAATWLITDPTKDELYLEVAAGVAQLRGTPYPVQLQSSGTGAGHPGHRPNYAGRPWLTPFISA